MRFSLPSPVPTEEGTAALASGAVRPAVPEPALAPLPAADVDAEEQPAASSSAAARAAVTAPVLRNDLIPVPYGIDWLKYRRCDRRAMRHSLTCRAAAAPRRPRCSGGRR